jgi:hypothetical protein
LAAGETAQIRGGHQAVKNYNPKKVSVIVGTRAISGFADGTFVKVSFDGDAFSKKKGADGNTTRSQSNDDGGKIVITLDQASDSNDYLSGLAVLDRASGAGVVPVLIRDAMGRTLIAVESAWVLKQADVMFSKQSEDREWTLDCASIEMFVGGNE